MDIKSLVAGRHPQTRREFCIHVCQTGTLLALSGTVGQLLVACNEDPASFEPAPGLPTIQATISNNTITLTIDSNSPLAAVGSAALVQYNGGSLLVAHTAQDTFVAVTAVCTHQACTITGFTSGVYQCPCHGSQFNTSGQVVRGPATSPLRSFLTQFSNGQLTITLS